eukprot:7129120-Heterocapsa_arctica.AAC.1
MDPLSRCARRRPAGGHPSSDCAAPSPFSPSLSSLPASSRGDSCPVPPSPGCPSELSDLPSL